MEFCGAREKCWRGECKCEHGLFAVLVVLDGARVDRLEIAEIDAVECVQHSFKLVGLAVGVEVLFLLFG